MQIIVAPQSLFQNRLIDAKFTGIHSGEVVDAGEEENKMLP